MDWILHILGVDNVSGPWYAFWSGSGSDLSEFALLGGAITLYRKHNCHVQGCWRLGRLKHEDWMVCHKHHPNGAPTASEVALSGQDGKAPRS